MARANVVVTPDRYVLAISLVESRQKFCALEPSLRVIRHSHSACPRSLSARMHSAKYIDMQSAYQPAGIKCFSNHRKFVPDWDKKVQKGRWSALTLATVSAELGVHLKSNHMRNLAMFYHDTGYIHVPTRADASIQAVLRRYQTPTTATSTSEEICNSPS